MVDDRLRRLEQVWLRSGAPEDRLNWIQGRLQGGELWERLSAEDGRIAILATLAERRLSKESLQIASFAGSVHARVFLGEEEQEVIGVPARLSGAARERARWCLGICRWPRARLEVVREVLELAKPGVAALVALEAEATLVDAFQALSEALESGVEGREEVLASLEKAAAAKHRAAYVAKDWATCRFASVVVRAARISLATGCSRNEAEHERCNLAVLVESLDDFNGEGNLVHLQRGLVAWALRPHEEEIVARGYSTQLFYGVGDFVDHVKFGRGIVRRSRADRVVIEFGDGVTRELRQLRRK